MIARLVARIGTVGLALAFVAALVLGGVGGGLVEHVRLTSDQQQGEQSGNQESSAEGQSGAQGASREDQTGSQSTSQEGNNTNSSQQGEQQ